MRINEKMKLFVSLEMNKNEGFSELKEYTFVNKDPKYSDLDALVGKKIVIGKETIILDAFHNPEIQCISVEVHQNKKAIFQLTSYNSIDVAFLTLKGTKIRLLTDV